MTAVEWLEDTLQKRISIIKSETNQLVRDTMIENLLIDIGIAKQMELEWQEYFFNCGRQYQLTGECTFNQVLAETFKK